MEYNSCCENRMDETQGPVLVMIVAPVLETTRNFISLKELKSKFYDSIFELHPRRLFCQEHYSASYL